MFKIYDCIATAHDLKLVALAAFICVLASLTAINLLRHARKSHGHMRDMWLAVSAISTGFGIWATHFVAMLAFTPGIPSGYNIVLTVLSLVAAILLTGVGLTVSLTPNWRHGPWLGGAIVAGGIAAMHYTGMAAFEIAGVILWDYTLVVTSIVLGAAIGAVALPVGLHGQEEKWKIGGAVLLTLAICSHHFTAMGAVSIIPNPTIEISPSALPAGWLAVGVALASFAIIGLALAGAVPPTATPFSATPTRRFTAPRPKAVIPIVSSRPAWAPRSANADCWNMICGWRSRATNCSWCISRRKTFRARASLASRPCCAGGIRYAARFRPPFSFRLPRRQARSWRSGTGC
jgi:NO-binding membrane sensor protein with MHYT domain